MDYLSLVLIICVIAFVGLMVFKNKMESDNKIRKDMVEFDTQKSVTEITNVLRSFDCQIERLNQDPFENGPGSEVSVLLYGEPTFFERFKHTGGWISTWGVQVLVDDLGNRRHVILVALGENRFSATAHDKRMGMAFSKDYRDKIATLIS